MESTGDASSIFDHHIFFSINSSVSTSLNVHEQTSEAAKDEFSDIILLNNVFTPKNVFLSEGWFVRRITRSYYKFGQSRNSSDTFKVVTECWSIENTIQFIIYKAFFIQFQVSDRLPLVLLIPVSTSGRLATQRETKSTGSIPGGTETPY